MGAVQGAITPACGGRREGWVVGKALVVESENSKSKRR